MVQAIHCTVAPVQAFEASPQRAWRLSTAATGSPGLMTGQEFRCGSTMAPVAGQLGTSPSASVPRGTQSTSQDELHAPTPAPPPPQLIPLSQPGKRSLKELGLSLETSEGF
ncbi:rCG24136, isoform CRA_a [Rattus norvegicus]|uniref:RCG24136, isoform CRA_a n=1 Tax=Rattus norvegicus TaxID=10116 RepID=A6KAN4_RAT|nr:rCG24136, isoform CRA_a [Rattus norvegicus]